MEWILDHVLLLAVPLAVVMAGLAVIPIVDWWLEKRSSVSNDGDDTPRVPTACMVTARGTYRFPTTTRDPSIGLLAIGRTLLAIGRTLLAIAFGAILLLLAVFVLFAMTGGGGQ